MGEALDTPDFEARLQQVVVVIGGRSGDVMAENSGSKSVIGTKTKVVTAIGQAIVQTTTAAAAGAAAWLAAKLDLGGRRGDDPKHQSGEQQGKSGRRRLIMCWTHRISRPEVSKELLLYLAIPVAV